MYVNCWYADRWQEKILHVHYSWVSLPHVFSVLGLIHGCGIWVKRAVSNHFKGYNSLAFDAFSVLCNHYLSPVSKLLHHLRKQLVPITNCSLPVLPPILRWPLQCSLPVWICLFWIFLINGISVCDSLWLTCYTQHPFLKACGYGLCQCYRPNFLHGIWESWRIPANAFLPGPLVTAGDSTYQLSWGQNSFLI